MILLHESASAVQRHWRDKSVRIAGQYCNTLRLAEEEFVARTSARPHRSRTGFVLDAPDATLGSIILMYWDLYPAESKYVC